VTGSLIHALHVHVIFTVHVIVSSENHKRLNLLQLSCYMFSVYANHALLASITPEANLVKAQTKHLIDTHTIDGWPNSTAKVRRLEVAMSGNAATD